MGLKFDLRSLTACKTCLLDLKEYCHTTEQVIGTWASSIIAVQFSASFHTGKLQGRVCYMCTRKINIIQTADWAVTDQSFKVDYSFVMVRFSRKRAAIRHKSSMCHLARRS